MSWRYSMRSCTAACGAVLALVVLLAGFAGLPATAHAEPPVPQLVKDINTANVYATYVGGAQVGDRFFFFTRESLGPSLVLWKTDGSAAGTVRVAGGKWNSPNIGPECSNGLGEVVGAGGLLFFAARDPEGACQLWRSDGTDAGTVALTHNTGWETGVASITPLNGIVYFTNGGIWKTDGTEGGTVWVAEGRLPAEGGDALFFFSEDALGTAELWKTGGTGGGTLRVKQFPPDVPANSIRNLTVAGSALFFAASDTAHGAELWKADGTEVGTIMVKDISPGSIGSLEDAPGWGYNTWFAALDGILYFAAKDLLHGEELWKSDGTEAGTVLVKDIWAGPTTSGPFALTPAGNGLFLAANDGVHGLELWHSDGIEAGTVLTRDIGPGDSLVARDYYTHWSTFVVSIGGTAYFGADDGVNGATLWKSNGTEAGTVMAAAVGAGFRLTVGSDTVYFPGGDVPPETGLWRSDGTEAGTVMVKRLKAGLLCYHPGPCLADVVGTLFFITGDYLLWKSDGTEAGTVVVKEVPGGWQSHSLIGAGGKLLFVAMDDEHGQELWQSDGTEAGTGLVYDIRPGPGSASPKWLTSARGTLYFQADDGYHGAELWALDARPGPWRFYLPITARSHY
jgi:ELWxxDGT repeat protein